MFLEDYEITDDENDFVASKVMQDWLKEKHLGISFVAFTKDIKKYCVLNNFDNVNSNNKKICGKVIKAWFGIRAIRYTPEEDGLE